MFHFCAIAFVGHVHIERNLFMSLDRTSASCDLCALEPIQDLNLKIRQSSLREYGSSGEDVSVNAVIIPKNWWAIPSEGRSPEEGYCSPILRNDDRIHRYI